MPANGQNKRMKISVHSVHSIGSADSCFSTSLRLLVESAAIDRATAAESLESVILRYKFASRQNQFSRGPRMTARPSQQDHENE